MGVKSLIGRKAILKKGAQRCVVGLRYFPGASANRPPVGLAIQRAAALQKGRPGRLQICRLPVRQHLPFAYRKRRGGKRNRRGGGRPWRRRAGGKKNQRQ